MALRNRLSAWTDWDGAQYELAVVLGLLEDEIDGFRKNKAIFWSSNPREAFLARMLQEMVKEGILEQRSEPDQQYRWKVPQPHQILKR